MGCLCMGQKYLIINSVTRPFFVIIITLHEIFKAQLNIMRLTKTQEILINLIFFWFSRFLTLFGQMRSKVEGSIKNGITLGKRKKRSTFLHISCLQLGRSQEFIRVTGK